MKKLKLSPKIDKIERRSAFRKNKKPFHRLSMSERIYDFPSYIFEDFLSKVDQEDLITYPSRFEYETLKEKIGYFNDVKSENILLFPGSDTAIRNIFELTSIKNSEVVTSNPCFPMYDVYSKIHSFTCKKVNYEKSLLLSTSSILNSVTENTSLVVLANPNSPVGDWKPIDEVREICKYLKERGIVFLVDEAYVEFSPGSVVELVKEYDNIIISRTFSKAAGCAGMRVGYTVSDKKLKDNLEKLHFTFPITNLATKFSNILMDNFHIILDYARKTKIERDELFHMLDSTGYDAVNSHCNWIHFKDSNNTNFPQKILNEFGVDFKDGALIPFCDDSWIRLTVGPDIINTDYIKEILKV